MSTDSTNVRDRKVVDAGNTGGAPTHEVVRSALDRVTDPELDRSIVELEYIDEISIEPGETGSHVKVTFTLPTAWCSPAFAWMMAADGREVVEDLSGVVRCEMYLNKHMHALEITEGVNGGKTFEETFPDADGGIAKIRATLDAKALLARQYNAVETLLAASLSYEQIARLSRDDLQFFPDSEYVAIDVREGTVAVVVEAEQLVRYLHKAAQIDCYADGSEQLFRTPEGEPIDPKRAEHVHRRARLAHVNMDGQGGVCDALHEARKSKLARNEE
jgi:metal-sulfur cluster biosynthetic enzyme